jgi:hypothetical protein
LFCINIEVQFVCHRETQRRTDQISPDHKLARLANAVL